MYERATTKMTLDTLARYTKGRASYLSPHQIFSFMIFVSLCNLHNCYGSSVQDLGLHMRFFLKNLVAHFHPLPQIMFGWENTWTTALRVTKWQQVTNKTIHWADLDNDLLIFMCCECCPPLHPLVTLSSRSICSCSSCCHSHKEAWLLSQDFPECFHI